jgi:hypothetical protein
LKSETPASITKSVAGIGLVELPTVTQCPAVNMCRGLMITPVHARLSPGGSRTITVHGAAVIDTILPPTTPSATSALINTMTSRTTPASLATALLVRIPRPKFTRQSIPENLSGLAPKGEASHCCRSRLRSAVNSVVAVRATA